LTDFVHSRVFEAFSGEEHCLFVSICGLVGNEALTFLLIESLRKQSEIESAKVEECCGMASESQDIYLKDFDVNDGASNFDFSTKSSNSSSSFATL
jgi:hypothetical protein